MILPVVLNMCVTTKVLGATFIAELSVLLHSSTVHVHVHYMYTYTTCTRTLLYTYTTVHVHVLLSCFASYQSITTHLLLTTPSLDKPLLNVVTLSEVNVWWRSWGVAWREGWEGGRCGLLTTPSLDKPLLNVVTLSEVRDEMGRNEVRGGGCSMEFRYVWDGLVN